MTISIIDRDYLINTLIDLVRIDSTNPSYTENGAGEGEIAHNVLNSMRNIGLDVETLEPEPGRVNVLGTLKGYGGERSLMLNAHTDTVGIEDMDGQKAHKLKITSQNGIIRYVYLDAKNFLFCLILKL